MNVVASFVCLALTLTAVTHAKAEYPDRIVRIELGFPAGGGADILARWYAEKLQKLSGGHFIVENKVGASGNLALNAAARAAPGVAAVVPADGLVAASRDIPCGRGPGPPGARQGTAYRRGRQWCAVRRGSP